MHPSCIFSLTSGQPPGLFQATYKMNKIMHVQMNCTLLYHFWSMFDGDKGWRFPFPIGDSQGAFVGQGKEVFLPFSNHTFLMGL